VLDGETAAAQDGGSTGSEEQAAFAHGG
jgi:hypothetical protein